MRSRSFDGKNKLAFKQSAGYNKWSWRTAAFTENLKGLQWFGSLLKFRWGGWS